MGQVKVNVNSKVAGFYKLEAVKLDKKGNETSRRLVADWFPNLVTNGGLNRMVSADYLYYCQVGSGSATPAFTDTALTSRIANNSSASVTNGYLSVSPYYAWKRIVYRFNEGVAAGNLSEVGVGWATTGSLFSRALILDGLGDPTTVTILADETLDVTYELRLYPKLTDDTGTVVFTGNIGGTYNWVIRPAQLGVGGWSLGNTMNSNYFYFMQPSTSFAGDGDIGPITGVPTGTAVPTGSAVIDAYVDNSLEVKSTITYSLTQGNHASGLKSLYFYVGAGSAILQLSFTPAIPKTSNDILTFKIKHSWGRV